MNERVIAQYCKKVGKKLVCGRAKKKRLLGGLAQELTERFGGSPVTKDELLAQVGAPADTAELLQESVTPQERTAFEKKHFRTLIAASVAAFVLLAACSIWYLAVLRNTTPVYIKREVYGDSPLNEEYREIYDNMTWGQDTPEN